MSTSHGYPNLVLVVESFVPDFEEVELLNVGLEYKAFTMGFEGTGNIATNLDHFLNKFMYDINLMNDFESEENKFLMVPMKPILHCQTSQIHDFVNANDYQFTFMCMVNKEAKFVDDAKKAVELMEIPMIIFRNNLAILQISQMPQFPLTTGTSHSQEVVIRFLNPREGNENKSHSIPRQT
uniref:Uncharacterized protein n=1 Tax=Romanomermis culicivorax TaxID=13658 RepID=A0A915INW4_ROMCU